LEQLADAYGVAHSFDTVADAIIAQTQITAGKNERDAVIALVRYLVLNERVLTTLEQADVLTGPDRAEMTRIVAPFPGLKMPADSLVSIVLANVASILQSRR
jgi:hypothetical protein